MLYAPITISLLERGDRSLIHHKILWPPSGDHSLTRHSILRRPSGDRSLNHHTILWPPSGDRSLIRRAILRLPSGVPGVHVAIAEGELEASAENVVGRTYSATGA